MSNCHTNDATNSVPGSGFHLMAKPVGPLCNLDCSYCFYLEKESLYEERHRFRMSDTALDVYVRRYIESQPTPEVEFTWQGGEPTLMGLDFFEKAVALQRRYRNGKTIRNTLQTNGTLLDERWGAFLAAEGFLVGISLDGPRELHDLTRRDKQGRSSFDDTVRGLGILQRFNVPFNVLVTVSDAVSCQPLTIYRFLKGLGVRHMQFNPVVERVPRAQEQAIGLHFAAPPEFSRSPIVRKAIDQPVEMSTQSVVPEAWGDFLIAIYDEWVRNDIGDIHVMNFEWALAAWCELPATVCLFSERCGRALSLSTTVASTVATTSCIRNIVWAICRNEVRRNCSTQRSNKPSVTPRLMPCQASAVVANIVSHATVNVQRTALRSLLTASPD